MVLQFFWTLLYLLLIRKSYHQTEMDQITWYVTYYQFYGLIMEFELIFFLRFGQETEVLLIKFGSSKEIWQQSS